MSAFDDFIQQRQQNTVEPAVESGTGFTGIVKSLAQTAKNTSRLGAKVFNAVVPKPLEIGDFMSDEDIQKHGTNIEKKYLTEDALKPKSTQEKAGKFIGDVAQFLVPQTKVTKMTEALPTLARVGTRAVASGAVGAAQSGDMRGALAGAGAEVGGAVVGGAVGATVKVLGRLLRGTASAFSGASSAQIKAILENPKAAQGAVEEIKKSGGSSLLRDEAKKIVEGVSQIRKEAGQAYREGLENLAQTDINPMNFRTQVGTTLDKYGSKIVNGSRVLENVEFNDPKNLKKASDLIDKLSNVNLDGKSLRKLADDIENSAYKIATSDERLSFNSFVRDLSTSLKDAVSGSTSKLDEINSAYSQEMQLVDGIQKIFGKVKFKNAKEILQVSQKLDNLFSQKGLAPEVVDGFLERLGLNPSEFRAGEAARQMGELSEKANSVGANVFELVRAFTAAIVPPSAVRELAIYSGISERVLNEIATKLSPVGRSVFARLLLTTVGKPKPTNKEQNNE